MGVSDALTTFQPAGVSSKRPCSEHPAHALLARAFDPRRVAVIGASGTPGKWSNDVLRLLIHSYKGDIVPINPTRQAIEGVRCFPSINEAPGRIDYAIIVVPRDSVLKAVRECVAAGVPVVHIFSAGFAEVSGSGQALQDQLVDAVTGSGTILIGPNSMGIYSASAGLSFAWGCHFEPGPVSFVSQSGGICYDVLARGQTRGIAFSKILSVGNCAHLDWPEYVRYLASDPETKVIALYIESVTEGYRLYEALKAAAQAKPVVVLKGGRTEQGGQSVVSHTGRLAGEYAIWRAMLRQAGVFEAATLEEVFVFCEARSQTALSGSSSSAKTSDDLVLIGTGGGATVLLTDSCEDANLRLAQLDPQTIAAFLDKVPDAEALGGVSNPIDVGADRLLSNGTLLADLIDIASQDKNVGYVLVHLNLVAVANNLTGDDRWRQVCSSLPAAGCADGAILCVALKNGDGGQCPAELQSEALAALRERGIAAYANVDDCLNFISSCRRLKPFAGGEAIPAPVSADNSKTAAAGHVVSGDEARRIVENAGIPVAPWGVALNEKQAVQIARQIGFPVAVKTAAADVTHKSDAGCVLININSPEEALSAYGVVTSRASAAGSATPERVVVERMTRGTAEVVVGLKRSSSFGACVLIGLGGIWVEVLNDFAVRLCPVGYDDALGMIRELKGYPLLRGDRGQASGDIEALAELVVAVSNLGHHRPDILELDLNPVMLLERGEGALAVDARAILHSP
ncbi:acetate--CoA ligase family protein [Aquamicrobium ahrensii]|uniref:Acetyltransferase n=1 Tax=Aquamicrobium ahrensii TaxID=469551 RepID=A0ABV2KR38_9HYPH